jgi:pimeloyl-ACP methyl ester carboxylesterase
MPSIEVNDIAMYYEIHGTGKPLVVVNGLAIDISEFEVITRPLANHNRVLVLDNRGAGRSDKPDMPYSIEMMAADTAALMQKVGFQPASVMGISMGGRIALELTLEHPEMVDKLLLVSTSARVIKNWRRQFLFNTLLRLPIFKGKYPQPYYAFARQAAASSSYNCTDRLHEIRKPTLIMNGKTDKLATPAQAEEMHKHIAGSKKLTFKGGHLFFLFRERQSFLSEVESFIS